MGVFAALAALLATVTVLLGAGGASAYPEPVCTVTVTPQRVVGGHPVTVRGESTTSREWRFELLGQVASGKGKVFTHRFSTPKTTKQRTVQVRGGCDGTSQTVAVILDPPLGTPGANASNPPDHNGLLPGTGGPGLWILLMALALVLVGLGVTEASRRRKAAADWT